MDSMDTYLKYIKKIMAKTSKYLECFVNFGVRCIIWTLPLI